jgi:hypothetical protein
MAAISKALTPALKSYTTSMLNGARELSAPDDLDAAMLEGMAVDSDIPLPSSPDLPLVDAPEYRMRGESGDPLQLFLQDGASAAPDSLSASTGTTTAQHIGAGLADFADSALHDITDLLRLTSRLLPTIKDSRPFQMEIGGQANAVGQATLAEGDIFSRMVDQGDVTFGYGTADFCGKAQSLSDDTAFASAECFANVSGADFVLTWTTSSTHYVEASNGSYASTASQVVAFAVDFERWDFRDGPILIEGSSDHTFTGELDFLPTLIEGNVATLDVDTLAMGGSTFVDVVASVLTIEDQLSSVGAVASFGVG